MALRLTPRALSLSNHPHRYGIWVPAFAGMSGSVGQFWWRMPWRHAATFVPAFENTITPSSTLPSRSVSRSSA